MKCPYCDVEMIPGFLNCGNTIWSERKHKISTLPGGKEKYALWNVSVLIYNREHNLGEEEPIEGGKQ